MNSVVSYVNQSKVPLVGVDHIVGIFTICMSLCGQFSHLLFKLIVWRNGINYIQDS